MDYRATIIKQCDTGIRTVGIRPRNTILYPKINSNIYIQFIFSKSANTFIGEKRKNSLFNKW